LTQARRDVARGRTERGLPPLQQLARRQHLPRCTGLARPSWPPCLPDAPLPRRCKTGEDLSEVIGLAMPPAARRIPLPDRAAALLARSQEAEWSWPVFRCARRTRSENQAIDTARARMLGVLAYHGVISGGGPVHGLTAVGHQGEGRAAMKELRTAMAQEEVQLCCAAGRFRGRRRVASGRNAARIGGGFKTWLRPVIGISDCAQPDAGLVYDDGPQTLCAAEWDIGDRPPTEAALKQGRPTSPHQARGNNAWWATRWSRGGDCRISPEMVTTRYGRKQFPQWCGCSWSSC